MLNEIGFGIIILAIFLLTGSLLGLLERALQIDSYYSIVAVVTTLFIIDNIRKDKPFIIQTFGSKSKAGLYLFAEYTILFLPLIIYKLVFHQFFITMAMILTLLLLSVLSPYLIKSAQQGYKKGLSYISLDYFEFKFFAEKRKILFYSILILLACGTIHISLWILGLVLMMSFLLEIFIYQEPIEMIRWKEDFVLSKIITYIKLTIPILLTTSTLAYLFADVSIWFFVYGVAVIIITVILGVSYKYATYSGFTEKQFTSVPVTIMVFLMLLPGFIIVTLGYAIIKYFQAEKNIKQLCSK